jgi:hypothetical protein
MCRPLNSVSLRSCRAWEDAIDVIESALVDLEAIVGDTDFRAPAQSQQVAANVQYLEQYYVGAGRFAREYE